MTLGQTLSQKLKVSEEVYRRNFFFFLVDGILFTVALNIMGPTTVIPDFVRRLTDSEIIIGVSSSIFSIGYTLPQIFVARLLVNKARKKWWFIVPNIPTRFVVLIFSLFIWFRFSLNAHTILILFLVTYAVAALGDGLVGVPWADLTGSSLNERWRARFYGFTSAGSGIIMLAATPLIALVLGSSGLVFPQNYAVIFGLSGVLFVISIVPVIFVHEVVDTKPQASVPAPAEYIAHLAQFIRHDHSYRRILSAQILTSLYGLGLTNVQRAPTRLT
jgi:MFS family permease